MSDTLQATVDGLGKTALAMKAENERLRALRDAVENVVAVNKVCEGLLSPIAARSLEKALADYWGGE